MCPWSLHPGVWHSTCTCNRCAIPSVPVAMQAPRLAHTHTAPTFSCSALHARASPSRCSCQQPTHACTHVAATARLQRKPRYARASAARTLTPRHKHCCMLAACISTPLAHSRTHVRRPRLGLSSWCPAPTVPCATWGKNRIAPGHADTTHLHALGRCALACTAAEEYSAAGAGVKVRPDFG